MTLLSLCQNVAYDLGVNAPVAPLFGSKVPVAQRLFAQARRAAQSVYRRAPWVALTIEYTFTADGVSDYPLPGDFGRMINDTLWERSRYWALRGSMSPQQWQRYKSSIYGRATIWRRWRIRVPSGDGAGTPATFSIDPPIPATDFTSSFVFEYVSKNWCVSQAAGQPQTMASDWTSDNDTAVIDEWLIELETRWRMMRRLGFAYDEDQDEANREIDKAIARDGGTATLDMVPAYKRDDFIGQYTLGAFPPVPPSGSTDTVGTAPIRLGPAPPSDPLLPGPPQTPPAGAPPVDRNSGGVRPMPRMPLAPVPPAPSAVAVDAALWGADEPLLLPEGLAGWRPQPQPRPPLGPAPVPRIVAQGTPELPARNAAAPLVPPPPPVAPRRRRRPRPAAPPRLVSAPVQLPRLVNAPPPPPLPLLPVKPRRLPQPLSDE
jgi:hypothetical protein